MCSTELLIGIVIIIIGAAIYGIIVYNRKVSKKIKEHYETKNCDQSSGTSGTRFVRIQSSQAYLQVSYVSVQTADGKVVSEGKSVTSSCGSCGYQAEPNVIVNGKAEARSHPGEWHGSANNDWIEIDLGQEFPVAKVVFYNRADCCAHRADKAVLTLLDSKRNQVDSAVLNGDMVQTFNFKLCSISQSNDSNKSSNSKVDGKNCVGFNPDVGPFDIPPYKSPCFANDLTVTNKNIYSILDTVAVKVDGEFERSRKIDKNLYEMANYNTNKLKSLMEGPVVTGIYDNLTAGRKMISSDDFTISPSLYQSQYFVDTGAVTQEIKQAIDAKVTELIVNLLGGSELQSTITNSSAFKSANNNTINILTKKLINYYQNTAPGDIVKAIQDNIQQRSNLDDKIKRDLNITIRSDPEIQAYLRLGASSDFVEGAFVFFRHVLSKNVPAIGACDDKSREIIVGGRICKIFKPDSMVQINYSYILNPNKASTDCETDTDNSSVYTSTTDKYPQWLFQPKDQSNVDDIYCQSPAFAQVACAPSQWDANKDPFYFKYIGGFNRQDNSLRCGDSPTELDLPQRVPMAILSLSIDKLIAKCKETVVGNANDVVKRCLPSSAALSLRCLNIDYDNNKPSRNIMHNSNKYYIKDNIIRMNVDANTLRIENGTIIPRFVYKENVNSPQLFVYGTKANQTIGKWYVLSGNGIIDYGGDSDGNMPDGRKECVCY